MKEAFQARGVVRHLAGAAIARNTKKFRLGAFWIIFSTFWSVIGYTVIFGGGVFHVKTPNHMPYFLYLIVGMMGWRLFQESLKESTRSFLRLRKIVTEFNFPLALVPTAGSSYALLQFLLYVIGYVAIVLYYWATKGVLYAQTSPRLMLMAVAGLALCLAFAWGIGLWTGPLTAWARDVRQVIQFVVPFYMFLTPVMYPIESLHGTMRMAAEVNPLSSPIEMAKVGLLGAGAVRPYAAIWSICFIGFLLISGLWFVSHYGHRLAAGMNNMFGGDITDDDDMDM
jgi:ABC-type polysaccharide/polyol phosphate export permease